MLSTILGLGLALSSNLPADQFTYHVQNQRASKVLQRMMPDGSLGLIPKGVTLKANDLSGEIVLEGPAEGIDELKSILAMFDVQPQHAQLALSLVAPIDHYRTDWSGSVPNNSPTTILDGETGISILLQPRINADATITVRAQFTSKGLKKEIVARLKNGESIDCVLHDPETKVEAPKGAVDVVIQGFAAQRAAVRITARLQG